MSRFLTQNKDGSYLEKIESMNTCKYRINDVCCNEESEHLGDWFFNCDDKTKCENFVKEDGIIEEY